MTPPDRWRQAPPTTDRRTARTPRHRHGRLAAVLPPLVLGGGFVAWRWSDGHRGPVLLVLAALVALSVVIGLVRPELTHRFGTRLASAAGSVASTTLFGLLGIVAVALPHLGQRLIRIDPLAGPDLAPGTRWIERDRRDVRATSLWVTDPSRRGLPRSVRRRRRLGAAAVGTVAVLLLGVVAVGASRTRFTSFGVLGPLFPARSVAPPFPDETPAAYEDADWYPQHQRDIRWLWTVATAWDPFAMLRIRDVRTQTVNVVDGARRTWRPPACDCERLTVWFYGGSAAFGLGQRDEHTIASELARLAWADGVALDIDNRGVPGWLHWQGANRFSWDVATFGLPDAAIFYDGFNEIFGLEGLDDVGDAYAPVDPYSAVYWETLTEDARAPDAPPGAELLPTPVVDGEVPFDPAELITERYERSRRMSAATGAAHDLVPDWFWQPTRWSRPEVDGEPDSGDFDSWRSLDADLQARLDPDVVDLTDALDASDEPFFYDDVHHNEDAARLIAEAMWAELAPRYTALAGS